MRWRPFLDTGLVIAIATVGVALTPWPGATTVALSVGADLTITPLGVLFGLVTVGAFGARRFVGIDRVAGSVLATTGSAGVVGYAITTIVFSTHDGMQVDPRPTLAVALGLVSGVTGLADGFGLHVDGFLERLERTTVGAITTASALLVAALVNLLGQTVIQSSLIAAETSLVSTPLSSLAAGTGLVLVAAGYMYWHELGASYIDLDWLDTRELLYCLGGFVGLLIVLIASAQLLDVLGVPSSPSAVVDVGVEGDPTVFLILIPLSFLFVGPAEELLFRNVIQKSLYRSFSTPGAIVVSSLLFAGFYLPAYVVAPVPAMLGGLSLVFLLSLLLGFTYARTDNLLVPASIHGAFNAFQYAVLYVAITRDLGVV